MRAPRLVALLLLLESRRRITARELAAELEISVRTVYRDLDALSASGVPLYTERGAHGGIRLLPGYSIGEVGLVDEEVAALPLLGIPDLAIELGLLGPLRAAGLKLAMALPPSHRDLLALASSTIHVDPGPGLPPHVLAHVRALRIAIASQRVVRLAMAAGRQVDSEVEPLGLVRNPDGWHLVGTVRGDERCIDLGQVEHITGLSRQFDRPPGFNLGEAWRRLRNSPARLP